MTTLPTPTPRPLGGPTAWASSPPLALDWAQVRQVLAEADEYYVTSVSEAGEPHLVPVLGVWVDERLHINTDPGARKARHWRANPSTAVLVAGTEHDLTIEGSMERVRDEGVLVRVAAAFPAKYPWWHPFVEDGELRTRESSTPHEVLAVSPRTVFGFGKADGFSGTRWDFPPT